jgi:hypothetical protein
MIPPRLLARGDAGLVNEEPDLARLAEVEHGREKRQAVYLVLTARRQHRRGATEHGAADTKAERVDLIGSCDRERHIYGANDAELDVVVPGQMALLHANVAP